MSANVGPSLRAHPAASSRRMIGVVCAPRERSAVAEFFELFKTPWSLYEDAMDYEILILTTHARDVRLEGARVLLAVGSQPTWVDPLFGIEASKRRDGGGSELVVGGDALALHGPVLVLDEDAGTVLARLSDGSPAAVQVSNGDTTFIRCGYDLFAEIERLLDEGQDVEDAGTPTLDLHIGALRRWLVSAAGLLVEIPPVRDAHPYAVCLTHDIDFLSLRRHRGDRTLSGFLYRATIGSLRDLVTGRGNLRRLVRNWAAVITLPLVYLGRIPDPWQPFSSYVDADPSRSTFFVIPFRNRGGVGLSPQAARRRRVGYDVDDVAPTLQRLHAAGNEIAVHGIDAWNSLQAAQAELERVGEIVGERRLGVRMHWLCLDASSYSVLDRAGYDYDATCGFNDAVGFKAGTAQVFRPRGVQRLLELPLHVQDTALFFPSRMNLSEREAWRTMDSVRRAVRRSGGVLTLSWHDRSLAPERLWDSFYRRTLDALRSDGAWFGTARAVVEWFRLRRSVMFGEIDVRESSLKVELAGDEGAASAGLVLRIHMADENESKAVDVPWRGETYLEIPLPVHAKNAMAVR